MHLAAKTWLDLEGEQNCMSFPLSDGIPKFPKASSYLSTEKAHKLREASILDHLVKRILAGFEPFGEFR